MKLRSHVFPYGLVENCDRQAAVAATVLVENLVLADEVEISALAGWAGVRHFDSLTMTFASSLAASACLRLPQGKPYFPAQIGP